MLRLLGRLVPLSLARCCLASDSWCATGIEARSADFGWDWGRPSVDIVVAQAPLFSSNPGIGQKLKWFNMYHTAVILQQDGRVIGGANRTLTIEFDSVTNVAGAALPGNITGDELIWSNDARFCITRGVLWGPEHWTKTFDAVARVTAHQAQRLLSDFVWHLNHTEHGAKPSYQLWKVVSGISGQEQTLVPDITCGQGVAWVLNYATTKLGATLRTGFELRYTTTVLNVGHIEPVNVSDVSEWRSLVEFYKLQKQVTQSGTSTWQKILDLFRVLPAKYVYDSNAKVYYKLFDCAFPWVEVQYDVTPIEAPPWLPRPAAILPTITV